MAIDYTSSYAYTSLAFTQMFQSLQVSTNGLVSFNQAYLSWRPIPFPFGRNRQPIIAPFWADFDFRSSFNTESNRVFYHVYERQSSNISSLERAVLDAFSARISDEAGGDFRAEWLMVVTWSDAVLYPYWWRLYSNEVCD